MIPRTSPSPPHFQRLLAWLALLLACSLFGTAFADAGPTAKADRRRIEQDEIRSAVARHELVPLPRILAIAAKRVPGDVLNVEIERESWGIKYEIKILNPEGRLRKVDIDARTGKIVKVEDD